eukprot:TRINITY_DN68174_c1_g1_i11.p1 TRINITY_DN68174_c1_g1~~TRINITY_DN68174_c1_g1_i11.p1  ORF type:complete len:165 (-),score=42.34 TRINITY_DN68174_c1_g1_i11:491-925(-)
MSAAVTGMAGCVAAAWWQDRVHLRVDGVDAMLSMENQGNDGVLQLIVHGTENEAVLGKLSDALEVGIFSAHRHLGALVEDRLVSCRGCAKSTKRKWKQRPRFHSLHGLLDDVKTESSCLAALLKSRRSKGMATSAKATRVARAT